MFKGEAGDGAGLGGERLVVDNLRLVDFGTSFSVEEYNHNAE